MATGVVPKVFLFCRSTSSKEAKAKNYRRTAVAAPTVQDACALLKVSHPLTLTLKSVNLHPITAKCSCGKNAAMHCDCEKSSTENTVATESCACGKFSSAPSTAND